MVQNINGADDGTPELHRKPATAPYDSTADTLRHSRVVGAGMGRIINELVERSYEHDLSKVEPPEKAAFDRASQRLRGLTYGSAEYKASLEDLGPALTHHYAHNRHHPEHHEHGVGGMTLMDLCEMLADWHAAAQRHDDGDLARSLHLNRGRFNIEPQLLAVLANTAAALGWIEQAAQEQLQQDRGGGDGRSC